MSRDSETENSPPPSPSILGDHTSAELLGRIVDSVADPIFVKDEQHRWIMVNQAVCDLMGHPRDALLGKSDFDFFPTEEAEVFWEKDEEVFSSGCTNINEERLTDGEGRTRVIVTKKSVLRDEAGKKMLVGVIRDITDSSKLSGTSSRSKTISSRRSSSVRRKSARPKRCSSTRRKWMQLVSSQVASRTTSTTCSPFSRGASS